MSASRFQAPLLSIALANLLVLSACAGEPSPDGRTPSPSNAGAAAVGATALVAEDALPEVTVYASPTCGCCSLWADHLRGHGFPVEQVAVDDVQAVKAQYGIPDSLQSCHTAVVDGYVVEGHVPAEDIVRLLAEQPEAAGLAVPGMPIGSPGMEVAGRPADRYDVLLVGGGTATVYARH